MSKITPQQRKDLADKTGFNEQYLYQCLTGRADMAPDEAIRVESESDGLVTRYDLCQKRGLSIWPISDSGNLPSILRKQAA